ncbi:hypothetical protein PSm6_57510 [Pseudomonas solani]|uniref:Uncharacterized protein n=1 Tax=Pseudomonas solani TaxID=2731552 RepID=A0ABN6C364_9PSED|nr:hypothetical protein PSm6_57510 [Pseudomonas solani]
MAGAFQVHADLPGSNGLQGIWTEGTPGLHGVVRRLGVNGAPFGIAPLGLAARGANLRQRTPPSRHRYSAPPPTVGANSFAKWMERSDAQPHRPDEPPLVDEKSVIHPTHGMTPWQDL